MILDLKYFHVLLLCFEGMSVMRNYMNIYRFMAVMVLVIQTQSNFLYGMLRNKSAVIPRSLVLPLSVIPQKFEKTLRQAEVVALCNASKENDLAVVERILKRYVKRVDATDQYGMTPLHWAGGYGNIDVVKMLIDYDANVNATDQSGRAPLHWTANSGHCAAIKLLIQTGADLNARNTAQQTPHDCVLLKLAEQNIVVQESRLDPIKDENDRIETMQKIAHNQARATKRERLEVCAYMLEHPDQINSILPTHPTKRANNHL